MAAFLTAALLCCSLVVSRPSRVRPASSRVRLGTPHVTRVAAHSASGRRSFTRDLLATTTLGAAGCIQHQNFAADARGAAELQETPDSALIQTRIPRLAVEIFAERNKSPMRDWRVLGPTPDLQSDAYPDWLQGKWTVVSEFDGVTFPLSRSKFPMTAAGARRMSSAYMPNIGSNAKDYTLIFTEKGPDYEHNQKEIIRAFWPEARLSSYKFREKSNPPKASLEYVGPTKKFKEVSQAVSLEFAEMETLSFRPGQFLTGESIIQDNIEQDLVTYYRHARSFELQSDGNVVSRERVATFANPKLDQDIMENNPKGIPLGIFEYRHILKRIE